MEVAWVLEAGGEGVHRQPGRRRRLFTGAPANGLGDAHGRDHGGVGGWQLWVRSEAGGQRQLGGFAAGGERAAEQEGDDVQQGESFHVVAFLRWMSSRHRAGGSGTAVVRATPGVGCLYDRLDND